VSDKVTTVFPTMGQYPVSGSLVNMSGERSPYTKTVPRKGPTSDAPDSAGGSRSQVAKDYNGPRCSPVTTIAYPNSPESGATQRNVRLMPKGSGTTADFWAKRATGGKI
jgi:hypothetical protein